MTHHNAEQGGRQVTDESPAGSAAERLARAREALADAEAAEATAQVVARDADIPEPARADAEPDPHDVARQIVLRQLTLAPRTRQQLADKLRQKGCDDEVATVVLDRMVEVGLVDDAAYARMLVRSRQESKGLARRALGHELRRKGVPDELIEDALSDVEPDSERDRARELVDTRLRTMRGLDKTVQTRRLAGFLARKGYDSAVAFQIIREALDDLPEHQRD
ncbi:regulatory protein RecX [Ornithinimicrobium cryptoxanthini]|uniref:Regulatory protein RecX n=1 Tax=Ornithinimicrobium cryptoxanthini TaxID=2934161 RepID=A0ABY4YFP6_9MICO|nr:regulatory protein RecX [Ornithinimicrobium cryptoxanthini]USQ75375.1 recombination regulator RecX [Ornithinimicrobium cryptoxanthini]